MVEELIEIHVFPSIGSDYCIRTWVEYNECCGQTVYDGIDSWIGTNLNYVEHWELLPFNDKCDYLTE